MKMELHEIQRKNGIYIFATINLCIAVYATMIFASYVFGPSFELSSVQLEDSFDFLELEDTPMDEMAYGRLPHFILYMTYTLLCFMLLCGQCAESTVVKKVFLVCGTATAVVMWLLCLLLAWNWHVHELVYHLGAFVMQMVLLMLVRRDLDTRQAVCNLSYITLTNELASSKLVIMPDEKIEFMK